MKHLNIKVWDVAEKLQEQGCSVFEMILATSHRAKEISKQRNFRDSKDGILHDYEMKPINAALKELEDKLNIGDK